VPLEDWQTLVSAVVLASATFSSTAQQASSSHSGKEPFTEQTAVETAYKAYLRAWKDKDYAALNRLLRDDCKAANFRGVVSTKSSPRPRHPAASLGLQYAGYPTVLPFLRKIKRSPPGTSSRAQTFRRTHWRTVCQNAHCPWF
jgi:hypothetical protein